MQCILVDSFGQRVYQWLPASRCQWVGPRLQRREVRCLPCSDGIPAVGAKSLRLDATVTVEPQRLRHEQVTGWTDEITVPIIERRFDGQLPWTVELVCLGGGCTLCYRMATGDGHRCVGYVQEGNRGISKRKTKLPVCRGSDGMARAIGHMPLFDCTYAGDRNMYLVGQPRPVKGIGSAVPVAGPSKGRRRFERCHQHDPTTIDLAFECLDRAVDTPRDACEHGREVGYCRYMNDAGCPTELVGCCLYRDDQTTRSGECADRGGR